MIISNPHFHLSKLIGLQVSMATTVTGKQNWIGVYVIFQQPPTKVYATTDFMQLTR